MKILCAKSGLLFTAEYFPFTHDTIQSPICHPCFSIPQKKLLSLSAKWAMQDGAFTDVDSYLLFLSLLHSSNLVEWRYPCQYTEDTAAIVANNMEDLIQFVGAMNLLPVHRHSTTFTQIAITKENNTLANVHYWIANWETNIEDYRENYQSEKLRDDLVRRELALEKLIKSPHREIQMATQIANWAAVAGKFPSFSVASPFGTMQCDEYWKLIIRKCINAESIFSVPSTDIQELIEHCEEYIEHGSIYAHTLMQMLRNGLQKQNNFLGLGEWESTPFVLMQSNDSVESANLQLLLATAPTVEPSILAYASRFEWLKAHTKWKLAAAMQQQGEQKS